MVRYWYKNGALRPDMMTVFIAMDPCTKVNGGLQVCYFGILHYITIEIHINPVIVTVIDYAVTFFFLCACVMLL